MYQAKKVNIMYVVVLAICLSSIFTLPQFAQTEESELNYTVSADSYTSKEEAEGVAKVSCRGLHDAYKESGGNWRYRCLSDEYYTSEKEARNQAVLTCQGRGNYSVASRNWINPNGGSITVYQLNCSQIQIKNFRAPTTSERISREKPTKVNFITTIFGKTTFELGDIRFEDLLNRFFRFIFAIVGIYLVLTLAVRGVQFIYVGLAGKVYQIQVLKDKVISAFVSLVILLLSYLILSTVNPDLVNLNLGIPSGGVKLEIKVEKTEKMEGVKDMEYNSKIDADKYGGEACTNGYDLYTKGSDPLARTKWGFVCRATYDSKNSLPKITKYYDTESQAEIYLRCAEEDIYYDSDKGYTCKNQLPTNSDNGEIGASSGWYLGNVGNTGRSSGPHVHFDVIGEDGKFINPGPYINILKVGGRPITSFRKSGVYGELRNTGPHKGIDYASYSGGPNIDNLPITTDFEVEPKSVEYYTDSPTAGYFIKFKLKNKPSLTFRILHLNTSTNSGKLGKPLSTAESRR